MTAAAIASTRELRKGRFSELSTFHVNEKLERKPSSGAKKPSSTDLRYYGYLRTEVVKADLGHVHAVDKDPALDGLDDAEEGQGQ